MTAKELIKRLKSVGWVEVKLTSGSSHRQFKHPDKPGKITVPVHNGDLSIKVEKSVLKAAGLTQSTTTPKLL